MDVRTIPRMYVTTVLAALRGPVAVAEKVLGQRDEQRPWPPRLAFDDFEANAKLVAGAVLGDEILTADGRREQARVAELRRADHLEDYAEEIRAQADDTFEARQEESQRRAEAAREREAQQKEAAEQRAAQQKSAVRKRAASRDRVESELEEQVDDSLRRQERDARLQAISAERKAVSEKRAALATEEKADEVQERIEQSRQARRSRS